MEASSPPPLAAATTRFVLPNSPLAPKVTRDLVAALLVTTGWNVLVDAARVCVSEVVTNVHLHTGVPQVFVDITLRPQRVTIAAWDDEGHRRPAVLDRTPDERAEGGRGLVLVGQLASSWGVTWPVEGDRSRKRVWFDLDRASAIAHRQEA